MLQPRLLTAAALLVAGALAWLAVFCLAGPGPAADPPAGAPAPAEEMTRVRALLICDTTDPNIGDSVRADLRNMRALLEEGFAQHKDRLELETLTGGDVTREAVLGYYRDLKSDPAQTLLCY